MVEGFPKSSCADGSDAYEVVAGSQHRGGDVCPELTQALRNRLGLVYVHSDLKSADHVSIVPTKTLRVCSYRSREARTM